MCRRVDCRTCGRPTFAGCGAHVEQVLGDVPATERCRCRETAEGRQSDPRRSRAAPGERPAGFRARLKTLLGR